MKKKKSNLSAKCERVGTLLMLVILLQSFGIGVSRAQSSDEPRLTVEFSETPFIDVINYIKRHTKFDFLYNNEEVQKILAVTHLLNLFRRHRFFNRVWKERNILSACSRT